MIIVATLDNIEAARQEARRASQLLGYPIAPETMSKAPARRHYVGAIITLMRASNAKIAVTTFLGVAGAASAELRTVRKRLSKAIVVAATVPPEAQDAMEVPLVRSGILIVGSHRSYAAALDAAKAFGRASGIEYDGRGLIYDAKRGLIWPDDSDDELYAGQYAPRRYDSCRDKACVSVERSEAYEGFRPGLYIVVAGIVGREDAGARLEAARRIVPTAYVKETTLYMGCMH
jgi:hypothetical protein